MRRRTAKPSSAGVGALLALLLLVVPSTTEAQQAGKVPRIGILWPYSSPVSSGFASAFREGLSRLGYVEGRTVMLEERWAEGKFER
ncbi:MAG: ABC transporter substrate-binding protein, partial [Candidatus Rokuibacteriota bacterium]